MRQTIPPSFQIIGQTLHNQYESIAQEPLPKRWIDLINYLNESERNQTRPGALHPQWRGFGGEVSSQIHGAQYWLDRAEEVRLQAEEMIYADLRREMLKIADGYLRLAKQVEERTAGKRSRA